MKAEHRKELQTNALSAATTRLVERIKTQNLRPQRRTVLIALVVLLVGGGLLGWWILHNNKKRRDAELWFRFDYPSGRPLETYQVITKEYPQSNQAKASQSQLGWLWLWDLGIQRLGSERSLEEKGEVPWPRYIDFARQMYEEVAETAKDNALLAAEARYNAAVARESMAATNWILRKEGKIEFVPVGTILDDAKQMYNRVHADFPDTVHGRMAKERYDLLEGRESRARIERSYEELRIGLGSYATGG
jgi:hypothetical protein